MLIDLGYEVVEAESAEEALQRFERDSGRGGVMTDNLMSGLTGSIWRTQSGANGRERRF